jgi:hypothetical protein
MCIFPGLLVLFIVLPPQADRVLSSCLIQVCCGSTSLPQVKKSVCNFTCASAHPIRPRLH